MRSPSPIVPSTSRTRRCSSTISTRPRRSRSCGEMSRVARRGIVVNDLIRGRLAWLGAWLLSHLATGNRYTRHDAPLSVRRAYTAAELTSADRGRGPAGGVVRSADRSGTAWRWPRRSRRWMAARGCARVTATADPSRAGRRRDRRGRAGGLRACDRARAQPASTSPSWSDSRRGGGGPAACSARRSTVEALRRLGVPEPVIAPRGAPDPGDAPRDAGRSDRPPDLRDGERRPAGGGLRSVGARSGPGGAGDRRRRRRCGVAWRSRRSSWPTARPVLTTRGADGTGTLRCRDRGRRGRRALDRRAGRGRRPTERGSPSASA